MMRLLCDSQEEHRMMKLSRNDKFVQREDHMKRQRHHKKKVFQQYIFIASKQNAKQVMLESKKAIDIMNYSLYITRDSSVDIQTRRDFFISKGIYRMKP